jgi:NAD(P)-dependent dehydrogenase (short-subunit alcohol dehydrogenase family)
MEQVRRQFETNVFGLMRMCQLVLPGMRRQAFGRIVNISSMGGRLTFPGGASTTRPSTRSRRSRMLFASRSRVSASAWL